MTTIGFFFLFLFYFSICSKNPCDSNARQFNVMVLDGPGGCGKTSTSLEIARRLNYKVLDIRLMYRAVAYACLKENIYFENDVECASVIKDLNMLIQDTNIASVFYKGEDITRFLYYEEINRTLRTVTKMVAVRESVVKFYRDFVKESDDYVVEGRDVGTEIFPLASCKVYLTAREEVCARRRLLQNNHGNVSQISPEGIEKVVEGIKKRDSMLNKVPVKAFDAFEVDSSEMSFDEVVQDVIHYCADTTAAKMPCPDLTLTKI